ncbi:MAG: outer membrane beta-barrel protein [Candidatus Kapabacteria bacterium]|jgi:outer membrane protein W|nr:outer membrane beta-barrel protein [Candidatus Kapabacteria bacterium]
MSAFFKYFSILIISLISVSEASAQLKPGSFGISASFAYRPVDAGMSHAFDAEMKTTMPMAHLLYTYSKNLQVDFALGIQSRSYTYEDGDEPNSETTLAFQLAAKYFFDSKSNVSPYLGGALGYLAFPRIERSGYDEVDFNISAALIFGGQYFLENNFALWAQIGLTANFIYERYEYTTKINMTNQTTVIDLSSTAVGASFYF